ARRRRRVAVDATGRHVHQPAHPAAGGRARRGAPHGGRPDRDRPLPAGVVTPDVGAGRAAGPDAGSAARLDVGRDAGRDAGRDPDAAALVAYDREHVWHPYATIPSSVTPLVVRSAEGVRLRVTTPDGVDHELVDAMASWWSAIHGYSHPALVAAAT